MYGVRGRDDRATALPEDEQGVAVQAAIGLRIQGRVRRLTAPPASWMATIPTLGPLSSLIRQAIKNGSSMENRSNIHFPVRHHFPVLPGWIWRSSLQ